MSEQLPVDQASEMPAAEQLVTNEQLVAEHAAAVRRETSILVGAIEDTEKLPDRAAMDSLNNVDKYSQSERVTDLPGMDMAIHGAIIGASRDPGLATDYFEKAVRAKLKDSETHSEATAKIIFDIVGSQTSGVARYREGEGAKADHRQRFVGHLDSVVKTVASMAEAGKIEKAEAARTTAFVRGMQLGVAPSSGRAHFAKRLEETLIQA